MIREALSVVITAFAVVSQLKVDFYNKLYDVNILDEYDFIIVGAGASGSVVAGRLSENSNNTVLLLEAGVSGHGDIDTEVPFFTNNLLWTSKDWKYYTEPIKHAVGQKQKYFRGKMGGGTASMNYMGYTRGSKTDYDSWRDLGVEGWSFDEVEPFFKKVENGSAEGLSDKLGKSGMIKLSRSYDNEECFQIIMEACIEIGYSFVDYLKFGGITEGISKVTTNIYNGVRQSSIVNYVFPFYEKSFESLIHKVLLKKENGKIIAYGVMFEKNGIIKKVTCRKEVILSAGTINSPQILMNSGIGPSEHLKEMGINVVTDLPGVGSNLQDHPGVTLTLYSEKTTNLTTTYNEVLGTFPDYITERKTTPLSSASLSPAFVHLRTNEPDHEGLSAVPTISMMFSSLQKANFAKSRNQLDIFDLFMVQLRPKSTGTVRLRSSDPKDSPVIDCNFLSDPYDMEILLHGMRIMEKMEATNAFKKVDLKLIEYSKCNGSQNTQLPRSEEYLKCVIKHQTLGVWHAACTNKMGAKDDPMAVLDSRLRVFGVDGLRVADASVMPNIVSANIQAACYMIGEKAAHMIKKDWGLL